MRREEGQKGNNLKMKIMTAVLCIDFKQAGTCQIVFKPSPGNIWIILIITLSPR